MEPKRPLGLPTYPDEQEVSGYRESVPLTTNDPRQDVAITR
jgi:hypothetical protein